MGTSNFIYDPKRGGIFAPDYQLVPYPAPIMRRQALLDIVNGLALSGKGNKYVEIGYGTGIFSYEFYRMGFNVYGYDSSDYAYYTAQKLFNSNKLRLKLKKDFKEISKSHFDIVGAYEVLEHIQNDDIALKQWRKLLSDNGVLLISVPAHTKRFGLRDERVGHFRRYDKEVLIELLEISGFEIVKFICYGFPLPLMIDKITEILVDKKHAIRNGKSDIKYKSDISGIARSEEFKYRNILPYRLLVLFSKVQRMFYRTNLGIGYIVAAKVRKNEKNIDT